MKSFYHFIRDSFQSRKLILQLAKNDFKVRYVGSYLGIVWAFIQPLLTVLIYWFVFQVGFRSSPVGNFPFILWLVSGIIPWFFFSEALSNGTNSLIEYSYLVKKVVFRISILPIVKIVSSLFVHVFFVVFIFVLFMLYGYRPSIYNIQFIYYSFCMIVLLLGLSWITSSIMVFSRDIGQIVGVILQIGFWLTPICWSYKMLPVKYAKLFKLNPIYYIVEGYRDTFINHIWFWHRYNQTMYFWIISIILFILGAKIFKKLTPHFSDVL